MQKYAPAKLAWLFLLAALASDGLADAIKKPASQGTMHIKSRHSVDTTAERAKRILEHHEFRVFGVIDHADNAKGVAMALPPTKLLVFGNPKVGTVLLRKNRLIGLDLPLKLLIWEDKSGLVWISYTAPSFLEKRHTKDGKHRALFERMRAVLRDISQEAAR